MSMNIMISATRKISFTKKNKKRGQEIQTIVFDAMQTPTTQTYKIFNSPDQIQAYIDYIMEFCSEDVEVPVYGPADIFGEEPPMYIDTYNYGKEHIKNLKAWIEEVTEDGYKIEVSVI
jgi:hypothetical protein